MCIKSLLNYLASKSSWGLMFEYQYLYEVTAFVNILCGVIVGLDASVARSAALKVLCIARSCCRTVNSVIDFMYMDMDEHYSGSPFVCYCNDNVLHKHHSKMAQYMCPSVSFGNSEGEHGDIAP